MGWKRRQNHVAKVREETLISEAAVRPEFWLGNSSGSQHCTEYNPVKELFHFSLKIHFLGSFKVKLPLRTQKPTSAQLTAYKSLHYSANLILWYQAQGRSFLPLYHSLTPSIPKTLHNLVCRPAPSAAGKQVLEALSVMFHHHLHIPTEPKLCTAPQHSLDNILHLLTATQQSRGEEVYGKPQEHSTQWRHHWTGNIQIKGRINDSH